MERWTFRPDIVLPNIKAKPPENYCNILLSGRNALSINGSAAWKHIMRTSLIVAFALPLLGCNTSQRDGALMSAGRAQILAVQLANEKASAIYHCRPFGSGQPAHFTQGRWVWVDQKGHGSGDIEARVELAANGSTNSVDLKLLDSKGTRGGF
jgi:hypothetical protein